MAQASKKPQYTSKGQRPNVSGNILKAIRADRTIIDKLVTMQKAWLKGQNPWMTIDNPNTNVTNKKRIRVRSNSYLGSPFAKKNEEIKQK